MNERVFSKRCGKCRERAMALASVPYSIQIDHDGRKYQVSIPDLVVPRCGNCGEISIDHEAGKAIDAAFRRKAKLLTPEEIRAKREALGVTQEQFAEWFGVAASTVSRWETGSQVQQHFHDGILRAFFFSFELRMYLAVLHGVRPTINVGSGETIDLRPNVVETIPSTTAANMASGYIQTAVPVYSAQTRGNYIPLGVAGRLHQLAETY